MVNKQEPKTHLFLKPCGCVGCIIVDKPDMYDELAKAFKYAAKHNETYQLVPTQQVREMKWECPQHQKVTKEVAKQNSFFEDDK
jgi:hypothetical protein